ncbi:MAG: hypothetical protein WC724_03135 [Candidatus Paceibacterota bacterium]|jgi:hypothetical protein
MKAKLIAILLATTTSFLLGCAGMESKAQPSSSRVTSGAEAVQVTTTSRSSFLDCRVDSKGNKLGDCIAVAEGQQARPTEYKLVSKVVAPIPSKGVGADTFDKKNQCMSALTTGEYRYYVPKAKYLKKLPLADGEGRQVLPIEKDACVHMFTIHGWQWVAQRDGDKFRFEVKDGTLKIYARDDCGNPVKEIVYLSTPTKEERVVEKEYRIFAEKTTRTEETGWYRKSRVVMREVVTETPIVVVSDGCYGCGSVGFSGYVSGGSGSQSAQINQTVNYNQQAAPVAPAGRILSGGTYPQAPIGGSIGGGTYPQAPRVGTIGGGTYPRQAFGGGTYAPGTFGGGTSVPGTFSGGTSSPGAGIGRITGGGTR